MLKEIIPPPTLKVPPEVVTPEDIARRRKLFKELEEIRKRIGPLDIDTNELIREIRGEWSSSQ
jgi:hypothetical protein